MKKLVEVICMMLFGISFVSIRKEEIVSICLDAGHGGLDGGCEVNDIKEKEINMKIVNKLKLLLEEGGYKVILTRNDDYDLAEDYSKNRKQDDMKKRVDIINSCDIFISIHQDKYAQKKVKGSQILINKKGLKLGENINYFLVKVTNSKRKLLLDNEKYLLVNSNSVGCIIETGFLSNDEERSKLVTDDYQMQIAYAIFNGVEQYINENV